MTVRVYYEVSKVIEVDDKYKELIKSANEELEYELVEDVELELPSNCDIKAIVTTTSGLYEIPLWEE